MNPVGAGSATSLNTTHKVTPQIATYSETISQGQPLKIEQNKITLSEEGKALLSALQDIERNSKMPEENGSMSKKVESFTYGALGMEHPDKVKQEVDSSYSAGQYLSAAATVGSLLLLLI